MTEKIYTSENIPPFFIGVVAQKIAKVIENGRLTFTPYTPLNVAIGIGVQFLWH
jgi:hypothetical protein